MKLIEMTRKDKERIISLKSVPYVEGYDFIHSCIVVPLSAYMNQELFFMYSPGITKLFNINYQETKWFVGFLETIVQNNFEAVWEEILKKFNLKTYFALVFMEATASYI